MRFITTHGTTKNPLYPIWNSMIQRCENPNNSNYNRYGGRGIKICWQWHSPKNFYKDMGIRPKGLTLERKNNNGDYEPTNCIWTTRKAQSANTRPKSYGPQTQRTFIAAQTKSGKSYRSNNQRKFSRAHKLCQQSISQCLLGQQISHKGWKFKWLNLGN